jgi:hypothetical protein
VPVLCFFVSACGTSHRIEDRVFADGSRGAVSLQSVDDALFKAAHPVSVSPQLITHILRGAQALPGDATTAMHVFSDDETRFLSPLISTALSQATEHQLVTFRVLRAKSSEGEAIGGTIYIRGRLLHFALTYYQATPDRRDSGEGQDHVSRHPGEREPSQLAFIPENDRRSSINEQRALVTPPPLGTLVVDYKMFGDELDLPAPTAQSQSLQVGSLPCPQAEIPSALRDNEVTALQEILSRSGAEDTQTLKELVCKQAIELDALKKDMRVLRHMLSEIEARKHKAEKPELLRAPRRRILNGISNLPADPSCNSIFSSLDFQGRWFPDVL